jgi:predicted regulator of Ras-like GTPase activity (Roadblock/LC7/MglB family)
MVMQATTDLRWLLDDLVDRVPGLDRAVVLSADGLLLSRSASLTEDDADRLAAVASAFQGLAKGTGRQFGGGAVRQTVVEMDEAFLFVTAAGRGACLAVLTAADADLGMVAYEVNLLVHKVGGRLSAAPRQAEVAARVASP